MVEITATKQNIELRMKRNEDSLRDLWDSIKCTNIHIIGSQRKSHGWRSLVGYSPQGCKESDVTE